MPDGIVITPKENGSYHVQGPYRIVLSDGTEIDAGEETWLCRCGQSSRKPFCDGTHSKAGFLCDNTHMKAVGD